MKIEVLGTGAVPSSQRSCGYLIDGCILVDNPNGGWKLIENLGYDLVDIDNILLTHFHADHYFDMPFVFLTREGRTDKTLNVFCGKSGPEYIFNALDIAFPDIAQYVRDIPINFNNDDTFQSVCLAAAVVSGEESYPPGLRLHVHCHAQRDVATKSASASRQLGVR